VAYNLEHEWHGFANFNMGADNGNLNGPMDGGWENTSSANVFGSGFSNIDSPGHAGHAEVGGNEGLGVEDVPPKESQVAPQ